MDRKNERLSIQGEYKVFVVMANAIKNNKMPTPVHMRLTKVVEVLFSCNPSHQYNYNLN